MPFVDNSPVAIEPFYFGSAGSDLYGCYHAPSGNLSFDCGLVLCNALGHEYIQFHRAVRRLATLLARAGFPVLRFDFSGCGDSAGDHLDWGIKRWTEDVSTAADQLRQSSGVNRICAIGLRLGGALSMLAGATHGNLDGMVLWDPVVDGQVYLAELNRSHQDMLRQAHVIPRGEGTTQELLGFPLPETLRGELESLDLLNLTPKPASRVLVIESHGFVQQGPVCRYLESLEVAQVKHLVNDNPHLWTWLEDYGRVHVPLEILQEVVSWVSAEYS